MIFKERFNFILFSIALFGVILSVVIQEYNSSLISFSHESRYGLIYTADEPSYILPARNWLDQGVWKDNTEGNSSFFQRPPGYGLLYALCEWIFGKNAYLGLKTIQISAYFFSILLMGQLLRSLLRKNDLALIGTGFFALLPIFHGFMYYPLTEGITPFLVLLFCYRILKKRDNFDLTLLLITSFLLLVRPQLIVLPVLFFIYSLLKKRKLHAATLILSFVPFLIWSLRTVAIEGEWKGLHPIYSSTNVTLFRPSHEKLTELFKVWEYDGERFHSIVGGLKRATSTTEFDQVLDNVPAEFRSSVKPVLKEYKSLLDHPMYGRSREYLKLEGKFIANTEKRRLELIQKNRFQHHIVTPAKSAIYLLKKSQLNLYVFQAEWRGNWIIEFLRVLSVIVINIGALSALILVFKRKFDFLGLLSLSFLMYFIYLIYFQRMNEERYLTPWLPVLYLIGLVQLVQMVYWIRSKKDSSQ